MIEDADTGMPLTIGDIDATASRKGKDTPFIDGQNTLDRNWLVALVDDAGVYSVEVSKPGFKTWVDEEVRVEGTQCGLETTRLVVRLERL